MDHNFDTLSLKLQDLQLRIRRIEEKLFGLPTLQSTPPKPVSSSPSPTPIQPKVPPMNEPIVHFEESSTSSDSSRLLGIIGIFCFVLAAGFLVKLAIDSGWLTPARQIMAAALLGLSLIVAGLKLRHRDQSYFSLLPAAGVIILYLTAVAGNRLYDLYSPSFTIALMSCVSVLSVFLFAKLRTEAYVAVATVGTYGSVYLLPEYLDPALFTTYFLIWDITFAVLAVSLESRAMLMLASYFSLGVFQSTIELHRTGENIPFVIGVQLVQFLIFSTSLIFYAKRNKALTRNESWLFFPILLFFYGIEYSLLHRIAPDTTPWIAIAFGGLVYGLYASAQKQVHDQVLHSGEMIYVFLAIVTFHALYLGVLPSVAQIWIGPLLLVGLGLAHSSLNFQRHWGIYGVVLLIGIISYLRSLIGDRTIGWEAIIGLNLLFSALLLGGYGNFSNKSEQEWSAICLSFAHLQLLVGTYRLIGFLADKEILTRDVKSFVISSIWGILGIGVLLWAKSKKDVTLARSALFILGVACAKLFLYDVSIAAPLVRVFCFLITGAVLYFGGYILRKVNQWR